MIHATGQLFDIQSHFKDGTYIGLQLVRLGSRRRRSGGEPARTSKPEQDERGKLMRIGASLAAAALSLALAANANATIVGSTYNFTTSVTSGVQISPLGATGAHTDPANPGFCVGPPVACGAGSGVSGSFTFSTVSPTLDHINFSFFGSNTASGSFTLDLGPFATTNGEVVTGVSFGSGSLGGATITESFVNGIAALTFSTTSSFNAIGGNSVVFNVATAAPEPASLAVLGAALLGFGIMLRRRKRV